MDPRNEQRPRRQHADDGVTLAVELKDATDDLPIPLKAGLPEFVSEDDHVAVMVSDTGIGIPEGLKGRIFEAFFTTKELGEGLGLGLAITYGIIKDYGGEIHVESEEGAGTTFKLTFPVGVK